MARHGANYASHFRLDRLRAIKTELLGTPYCRALQEQNSCHYEARLEMGEVNRLTG